MPVMEQKFERKSWTHLRRRVATQETNYNPRFVRSCSEAEPREFSQKGQQQHKEEVEDHYHHAAIRTNIMIPDPSSTSRTRKRI